MTRLAPVLVLWAIAGPYLALQIDRGWIPHDEGMLGQVAERVLQGELPHRDFDDVYTGGQALLHAAAFRVLGVDLVSIRVVLLLFVLAWIPVQYYVASRFVGPFGAGLSVLLAVAWTVPNYPAAIPSWFNLFFAVGATACVIRHVETSKRRWLVAAGACAGVSCLFKIVGLYLLAGLLLFVALHEQARSARDATSAGRPGWPARGPGVAYVWFSGVALALFLTAVVGLVGARLGARELVHFVAPAGLLVGAFAWREWELGARPSGPRFRTTWELAWPVGVGFALPVAAFVLLYAASGAADALWRGLFVLPLERFSFAAVRPPTLRVTVAATAALGIGVALMSRPGRAGRMWRGVGAVGLVGVLLVASGQELVYRLVWYSVRLLPPLLVGLGLLAMMRDVARRSRPTDDRSRADRLRADHRLAGHRLAVLCVLATATLVQFPFSTPIYYCYVVPLVVVAALAVTPTLPIGRPALAAVGVFYLVFAVSLDNRGVIYTMGNHFRPADTSARLDLPRGGLRIGADERDEYEGLMALLGERGGETYTYAGPDAPEVYFLSGLRNPTRTVFDFFDAPEGRVERIVGQIEDRDVRAVVINRRPGFSGPMPPPLVSALEARFPDAAEVGRFEVRWR